MSLSGEVPPFCEESDCVGFARFDALYVFDRFDLLLSFAQYRRLLNFLDARRSIYSGGVPVGFLREAINLCGIELPDGGFEQIDAVFGEYLEGCGRYDIDPPNVSCFLRRFVPNELQYAEARSLVDTACFLKEFSLEELYKMLERFCCVDEYGGDVSEAIDAWSEAFAAPGLDRNVLLSVGLDLKEKIVLRLLSVAQHYPDLQSFADVACIQARFKRSVGLTVDE